MQKIQVTTGLGYIKDASGNIIAKAELPIGEHPLKDGYTYEEVNTRQELNAIEVYQDPSELQAAQQERKIAEKLRTLAINELIKDENWP